MNGSCATFSSCWRAASSSGTPLVQALMGTTLVRHHHVVSGVCHRLSSLAINTCVTDLVARHGIEPYPLAFQTSTLPSSSRAKLGGRCETRTRISRLQAVGNPLIRTAQLGRDERIELS